MRRLLCRPNPGSPAASLAELDAVDPLRRVVSEPPLMTDDEFAEWVKGSQREVIAISRRHLFPDDAQSERLEKAGLG